MDNDERLEEIHNSLLNGNFRQLVDQIKDYRGEMGGEEDFWIDYKEYLHEICQFDGGSDVAWDYFTTITITFFRFRTLYGG